MKAPYILSIVSAWGARKNTTATVTGEIAGAQRRSETTGSSSRPTNKNLDDKTHGGDFMTGKAVHILNGPNLNLLGAREPEIYGADTLADIEKNCQETAKKLGLALTFRQTNSEGALVDHVQEAGAKAAGLIINPGAYTHTSIALLDALTAISIPKIELHLSNIHARETFRQTSVTARAADGMVLGFGAAGYPLALEALKDLIEKRER